MCELGQGKHKHKKKELFPSSPSLCCMCELGQCKHKHKRKRNGSIFLSVGKQTNVASRNKEKHSTCVYPCAYAYITRVNILVLIMLTFMVMLVPAFSDLCAICSSQFYIFRYDQVWWHSRSRFWAPIH